MSAATLLAAKTDQVVIPTVLSRISRSLFLWSRVAVLAALLSGCQFVDSKPAKQSIIRQSPPQLEHSSTPSLPATAAVSSATPALTATAKRGTLEDTVVLSGLVVPAQSAQLSFESAGTVRTVYVRPGQSIKRGEPLVELDLDETALQTAQLQGAVADPTTRPQVEEARAAVARAEIAVREAERARDAASRSPASMEVQQAQLALEWANDDLARAQEAARRPLGTPVASTQEVRAAERKVAEATIRRDQLLANQANAEAAREVERRRAQQEVDQARDDLARAQSAARQAQEDAQLLPPPEAGAVRAAERQATAVAINAGAAGATTGGAATNSTAERQLGQLDRDAANDAVAQAQQAEQRAAQRREAAAQSGVSPSTLAVRVAQRRLDDATARRDQLEAAPPATAPSDLRLADLALAQAQDELAQAQAAAQLAVRQQQEAAESADSATSLPVRAAERRRDEAALRLEQARAKAAQESGPAGSEAQRQLLDLQVTAARETLATAEASLKAAQSSAAVAPNPQSAPQRVARLVAPFDGTVRSVEVRVNQSVAPNATVIRLDDPSHLAIEASASDSEAGRLVLGQPAAASFAGIPDTEATGMVSAVSPVAISEAGRAGYPVRVDLHGVPPTAQVGMPATVRITTRQAENVVYVPTTAIRLAGGSATVTRMSPDGGAEEVSVVLGGTYAGDVEIRAGLSEGDVVGIYTSR
jgi:RND family efflux transporter MFP subunit